MTIINRSMYLVTFKAAGIAPVSAMLGADAITPSGYGGWTVVSRQRRVGLTIWNGKDPIRMPVPIVFDGVRDGKSQEVLISRLNRMALPPTTGGEPPTITIDGAGVPKPGPTKWVIENIVWGTNVIWDFAGNGVYARLRQDCVVNLLEYRAPDRAALRPLMPGTNKTLTGQSATGWPKTYVIKAGDTLSKIAARFYHDATKWKLIANANKIRDPSIVSSKAWVGKRIRIPAP